MEKNKMQIMHPLDFEKKFVDEMEEDYLPLYFPRFRYNDYLLLKKLEETFYHPIQSYPNYEDFQIWEITPMNYIKYGDCHYKEDGLLSSAIWFMGQFLPFNKQILLLIKKNPKLKKRIKFALDSLGLKNKFMVGKCVGEAKTGPNKNFFKNLYNENNKRNPIDSRLRHECFKRDGYKCVECGATNKEKVLHCDHIIPVSQGGSDELDNLQTLCDDCNLAKSDKKWNGGKDDTKHN